MSITRWVNDFQLNLANHDQMPIDLVDVHQPSRFAHPEQIQNLPSRSEFDNYQITICRLQNDFSDEPCWKDLLNEVHLMNPVQRWIRFVGSPRSLHRSRMIALRWLQQHTVALLNPDACYVAFVLCVCTVCLFVSMMRLYGFVIRWCSENFHYRRFFLAFLMNSSCEYSYGVSDFFDCYLMQSNTV